MIVLILLTAAFAATSIKTIFSYITSLAFRQPYQEPYLLAALISEFNVADSSTNRKLGTGMEYMLGLLFVLVFQAMLTMGWLTLSYDSILFYGILIGVISIVGWLFMFLQAGSRPQMNTMGYYTQLFLANIVFAFTMAGCYTLI